jgi:hypothetical protein
MIQLLITSFIIMFIRQEGARSLTPIPSPPQARGKFATDKDRLVLETLLLHMLGDDEFPPAAADTKTKIVLHRRTPKEVKAIVDVMQINYETGGHVLPNDAWNDLKRRNVVRLAPGARLISYENLQFEPRIEIGNAFPGPESTFLGKTFEEAFPAARGWLEAYIPGYSKDGKTAVVRGRIGPTEKRAMVTAILESQRGKWQVSWLHYCLYH